MDEVLECKPIVVTPEALLTLAVGRLMLKPLPCASKHALLSTAFNKLNTFAEGAVVQPKVKG